MAPIVSIEFVGQKVSKRCSFWQLMGKSRKYSKGLSSGFVPDYRHAVETMAESEGFGSSGRVDIEVTASEDSCAPKRKCIRLNADSYDCFGVPMQVLSLSKMSRTERKDLELRLKMELEEVRVLQRRVALLSSNVALLSPSSDIWSCSDGQKRPAPETGFGKSLASLGSQGRKQAPGRIGACLKRSTSRCFEAVKTAVPASTSDVMVMKQCETLLNRLMSHPHGYMFSTPVDVVKFNIPDYFTVIKHPMDLGTVKSKLGAGEYSSPAGFAADVRLTFSNAMTYNPPGHDVHSMAEVLSKYFEMRWKAIEKKLPTSEVPGVPSRGNARIETKTLPLTLPSENKKMTSNDHKVKAEPVRPIMNNEEKLKLSAELEALLVEPPESIVNFLKEQSLGAGQTGENEIEIDIDALSDETLFKLRELLDDYLVEKKKSQSKVEPCEMEIVNESGFSNLSMPPVKGNDLVEEDVDIVGGNDPHVSRYPLVEIEKDAEHKNRKCSSSSSSSSESGSSSSDLDSDSSSSSGNEHNAAKAKAKASVPIGATKDKMGTGTNTDQMISGVRIQDVGNQPLHGLHQGELNSQGKPIAVEADGLGEGESAPSERQVSPDKLYRAALLRNRFADTILKAREKALEKGEKRDPEKLRIEREELERRHREEKARLQAEAKAAEEARRKAEVEAAAEVKRKRELEREAARQALRKMEKTVDINENSQFMEDLQMLSAANNDHLPSFIEGTSADQSQHGLGSFKLQGKNNPLEQLGLYMKDDDDEEEESDPQQSAPEPINDVEEGEID